MTYAPRRGEGGQVGPGGVGVGRPVAARVQFRSGVADVDDDAGLVHDRVLRAVRSPVPENQAAFLDELAKGGLRKATGLELIAENLDELYPDEAAAAAAVRSWRAKGVDLIIALSSVGARIASAEAPDAKVLFLVNDPLTLGLVTDVRRPSGNATGVTFKVAADRTLDLARSALPAVTTFGIIYPPADAVAVAVREEALGAATALGVKLVEGTFVDSTDAGKAVEAVQAAGAGAVWVLNSPTTFRAIDPIVAAAAAGTLPLITNTTAAAAIITLQPDTIELYRQLARQTLRIRSGTPVAEIPVENPSRFVVEVNTTGAQALGLTIPPSVVKRADRVR